VSEPNVFMRPAAGPPVRRGLRIERDVFRWAAVMLVVGVVAGLVIHFLDGAPESLAVTATGARVVIALVAILGSIFGVARLVMLREAFFLAAIVALVVGTVAAYPFGPTWIPGATVSGTYTLAMPGMASAGGTLTCEWLPGRWRVGSFAATSQVGGPGGERLRLAASFALPEVRIDRAAADGSPRASYVNGNQDVLEPPRLPNGQPARTKDGSSGQDGIGVVLETSSRPAGAPAAWADPLPADAGHGLAVDLTWHCEHP
jgi:hypothetical protein